MEGGRTLHLDSGRLPPSRNQSFALRTNSTDVHSLLGGYRQRSPTAGLFFEKQTRRQKGQMVTRYVAQECNFCYR